MEGTEKDFFSSWSELNRICQGADSGKIMNFFLVTEIYHYLSNSKTCKPMEEYNACV